MLVSRKWFKETHQGVKKRRSEMQKRRERLSLSPSLLQRAQGFSCHVGGKESFSKVIGIIIIILTARKERKERVGDDAQKDYL